ncbi:unnamed protein product [Gongylonema pulchrum]|uniref:Reverse transcriptase domain-containing protein n=1 Tax=Gongylonema pulchrum TaxID=637853 RepID=A0A183ENN5_9BILA|nr:unnamed protein product [Gongylonema pulchrum]
MIEVKNEEPDILIGSNVISILNLKVIKHLPNGFAIYDSRLGPMIGGSGYVEPQFVQNLERQSHSVLVGTVQLKAENLWDLDRIGTDIQNESVEDVEKAMMLVERSITRLKDGRYSVGWPWRTEQPNLTNNFGLCVGRLQSVLRRLRMHSEHMAQYNAIIQQQLQEGSIELAPIEPTGPFVNSVSSPFLLASVIRHHLSQCSSRWSSKIASNIYVDNVLLLLETEEEALEAYQESKQIFLSAKMNLRDYISNSIFVSEKIRPEDRYPKQKVKCRSEELEWHIFTDASSRAYCAAVYARSKTDNASPSSLIISKYRISPIQGFTIPRLELLGVLIGCDSKCVLPCIEAEIDDRLPRFVKNRLKEIKKVANITYRYITTAENPAVLATRGLSPSMLSASVRWWNGPDWLSKTRSNWPCFEASKTDPIQSEQFISAAVSNPTQISRSVNPAEHFSSWNTLIDTTAYALRFLRKIARAPATWLAPISKCGALQVKDRKIAQNCLFRQAQRHIREKKVIKWVLFLDEDKFWRCGGRLTTTRLPQQEKHPIFLPRQSRITQLLLLHVHQSLLHSGVPTTLAQFCKLCWTPPRAPYNKTSNTEDVYVLSSVDRKTF